VYGAAVSTRLYCRRNRVALSWHRRKLVSPVVSIHADRETMDAWMMRMVACEQRRDKAVHDTLTEGGIRYAREE
jgi:hypothetical protein